MKKSTTKKIKEYFCGQEIVWARPGTNNHSANFYGDSNCCPLTQADVLACIDTAIDSGWKSDDGRLLSEKEITEIVLNDLQKFAPEDQ
jgi:hypothetical protein